METKKARPKACTDEHLEYLDELRLSGVTNMWGANSYLQREFPLSREEARDVLVYWMETFSGRHPRPTTTD